MRNVTNGAYCITFKQNGSGAKREVLSAAERYLNGGRDEGTRIKGVIEENKLTLDLWGISLINVMFHAVNTCLYPVDTEKRKECCGSVFLQK